MSASIKTCRDFRWMLATILCLLISACEYFPESSFKLSEGSRLPNWVSIPAGMSRSEITVTLSYFSKPWGRSCTLVVEGPQKEQLVKLSGKVYGNGPMKVKSSTSDTSSDYPSYELITINNVAEVIEHRRQEPIFYVTDDPAVLKALEMERK